MSQPDSTQPIPNTSVTQPSVKDKVKETVNTKTGDEKQEQTKTAIAGDEKKQSDSSASNNPGTVQTKTAIPDAPNARPGDVIINSITVTTAGGETADITPICQRVSIYENIFSPTLSGNVFITDAVGLMSALPLTTYDRIDIRIQSPAVDEKVLTFAISSIDGKKGNMDKASFYTVHLISWEGYIAASKTFAKTYRGKYNEIVENLFKDHLTDIGGDNYPTKQLITDETENSGIVYVPYWNVLKTVNYIANRSMPSSGSTLPTYFFYETTTGFNFKAVENFYKCEPIINYIYSMSSTLPFKTSKYADGMKRIISMEVPKTFGGLDLVSRGCFGAIVWAKDINNEGVQQNEYTYSEYRDKVQQYIGGQDGMKPPVNAFNHELSTPATHKGYTQTTFLDDNVDDAMKFINWEVFRNCFITEITKLAIKIKVFGTMHFNVGDIVEVTVPDAVTPVTETPEDDRHWGGRYFISAIHHQLEVIGRHTMTLELSKNYFKWSPPSTPETESSSAESNSSTQKTEELTSEEAQKKQAEAQKEAMKKSGMSDSAVEDMMKQQQSANASLGNPNPVGKDAAEKSKETVSKKVETESKKQGSSDSDVANWKQTTNMKTPNAVK